MNVTVATTSLSLSILFVSAGIPEQSTRNSFEEIHFWKQRENIWDYLKDATYCVLLSDSEGLPYTVQEALQYQIPCIVTDVGGCTELIKDGVNGYVVPLDMNFDVNKLLNIPKCKEYDNNALEDWLKFLNYDGKKIDKNKLIQGFEKEEIEMKVKVRAIIDFDDIEDGLHRVAHKSEWICDKERADYLIENKAVEILEEIKPEVKEKVVVPLASKEKLEEVAKVIKKSVKAKKTSKK